MIAAGSTALAALLAVATPAHAHDAVRGIGGFQGGLLHPFLVPAHALALVSLGLMMSRAAPRHRAGLLAVFAGSLVVGVILIVAAFAVFYAAYAVLGVAAVAGLLVAVGRPLPALASGPLTAISGLAIELDSVPQEISMLATFLALVGTLIGAVLIVAVVAELAARLRRDWQRIGVRVVGSWIAAVAILVLALRLA
jgi:urease accessory protein